MTIPITVESKRYFEILLIVLYPILRLKRRELQIVSALMSIYNSNKGKVEGERLNAMLFSTLVKKKVRESLDPPMSEASYNNHVVALRKKKVFVDEAINKNLLSFTDGEIDIEYKLRAKQIKKA